MSVARLDAPVAVTLAHWMQCLLLSSLPACCFDPAASNAAPSRSSETTDPGAHDRRVIDLSRGFEPRPQRFDGTAGGALAAATLDPECRGFVPVEPHHLVLLQTAFSALHLSVHAREDTTLVIERPDGTFLCNDDQEEEGFDPGLVGSFAPGLHRVWIGTFNASARTPYALSISEGPTTLPEGSSPQAGTQVAVTDAVPTECGQSTPFYGALAIGTSVVLGEHRPVSGSDGQGGNVHEDRNWMPEMQPFVGRRTTVRDLAGLDASGCPGIHVEADGGRYFWRIRDVQL